MPIVAETDYIATVPRNLARSFEAAWGVSMHRPPVKLPAYDVTQYWHARFHHEPGLVWLRQHMKALFTGS